MDFKILLLVLCITFASVQGAMPQCCKAIASVHKGILKKVQEYSIQKSNGLCEIDALVLYVNGKSLCAPLRQRKTLEKFNSTIPGQKSV